MSDRDTQSCGNGKKGLVKTSCAFPEPLLKWAREEAKACGMSLNSWLTMHLEMTRRVDVHMSLRRIEGRLLNLETWKNQCNSQRGI